MNIGRPNRSTEELKGKVNAKKTSCRHKPEETTGPIGMYHCPDCGTMVVALMPHPTDEDCKFVDGGWEPPEYQ